MTTTDSALLEERFDFISARESSDHPSFNCPAEKLVEFCKQLKGELGYDMLLDVTAIDWDASSPRFTGMYHFLSTNNHQYLRVAVDCADDINPRLPSLAELYPAANWHERETYDLMGIVYEGHPDLKRILMWDGYPYYPLRKDFPLAGIDTPLPADDVAEITGASVKPAPMMGGPFVSSADGPMSQIEPRGRDESWTEQKEKPAKG